MGVDYRKWLGEKRGKRAAAAFREKGWQVWYAEDRGAASVAAGGVAPAFCVQ